MTAEDTTADEPKRTVDTVLTGGTVVTATDSFEGGIAIDGEEIAAVGDERTLPEARETIDVSGMYLLPGVVDPHVHALDPFTIDTYETATKAAALGGTTTFINFAWEGFDGEDSYHSADTSLLEGIEYCKDGEAEAVVDYGVHGTLAAGDPGTLELLEEAVELGVTSFKMFTAYEVGLPNGYIERVLERLADLDAVGLVHTEDGSVCDTRTEQLKSEGKGGAEWYPTSRPDHAEAMAAEDAVRLATEAGAKYYGVHTSCRKAAEVLASFQEDGSRVRTETCTHYTVYDDSVYAELGNLPMIAPPIRKPDDVEAMFEHIRNGTVSVVSTDHCAYTRESKQVENWWDSSFGANGLQTSLEVFYDIAVNERGLSPSDVVKLKCRNPARTFGLPGKGTLTPGTDADIVVFDPEATWTIDPENNASNADFSIYEGREITGRVEKTFVRGESVADEGEIVADPGHGEFIERDLPTWEG